jgi:hypothetical protein
MTTVAWDGVMLAADRNIGSLTNGKIFQLKNGEYVAGAGYYDQIVEIVRWMDAGERPARRPALPDKDAESSDIVILRPNKKLFWLTWPYLRRVPVLDRIVAVGSGSAYALGAMAAGANAKQAIEIASRYDGATGGGIDVVCFE